jgi:hypothetical protein
MMSAKAMSDAIRMKRKTLKAEGVDKMVDTAALPQMNPTDVLNLKQEAQMDETMDLPEKNEAPSDPADADISGTSQDMAELKKKMARIERILGTLKVG